MIIMYTRKPTQRFTERVNTLMLHDQDWCYLAEAVDAKNKCEALMAYMKQCAEHSDYLSTDVVSYIMTGKDFDGFKREVRKEKKN